MRLLTDIKSCSKLLFNLVILIFTTFSLLSFQVDECAAHNHQKIVTYLSTLESSFWIEGISTLHDYSIEVNDIQVTLYLSPPNLGPETGQLTIDPIMIIKNGGLSSIQAEFPIYGFKSRKKKMDQNIRQAMKANEFPSALFSLSGYKIISSNDKNRGLEAILTGILSVAGVENSIEIPVQVNVQNNTITLQGKKQLSMSEYDVLPPTFLFGLFKTDDRITAHFYFALKMID